MNKTDEWDGREVMRGTGHYDAELGPVRLDVEWSPWTAGHGPLGHFWYVRGCVGGRPVSWGWVDYDVGRRLQDEGFYDDEVRLGLRAGFEGWVDDGRVRIDVHARPTTARQQGILRDVLDAYGGRAVLTALPSGELTLRPGYRWWAVSPELLGGRGCRPVKRRTLMARRGVISEVTRWILEGHGASTATSQDSTLGGLRTLPGVGADRWLTILGAHRLSVAPGVGLLEEGRDGLQRAFAVIVGERCLTGGQMGDKAFWACVSRGVFDDPVYLLASAPLGPPSADGILRLELHIMGMDGPTKAVLEDIVHEHGAGLRHHRLVEGDVALSLGQRDFAVDRGALTPVGSGLPAEPVGLRAFEQALNPVLDTLVAAEESHG